MKRVALATCNKFPDLTADDQLVLEPLKRRQIDAQPVVWNSRSSWDHFDAVIIRSCWDYHFKAAEFLRWVRSIEACGVSLWNPSGLVEPNIDKVYLKSLQERGARIVPTVWLDQASAANLTAILEAQNWETAVIKPSISATAFQTRVVARKTSESEQARLSEILVSSGALVQQFVPEIKTNGEWSFIFFARKFSHAVLKQPKEGDFRVQEQFGGYLHRTSPSLGLIEQAQRVVDLIEGPCLFARVDGIEINRELHLMELELIEPALFLREDLSAAERFADAIVSLL